VKLDGHDAQAAMQSNTVKIKTDVEHTKANTDPLARLIGNALLCGCCPANLVIIVSGNNTKSFQMSISNIANDWAATQPDNGALITPSKAKTLRLIFVNSMKSDTLSKLPSRITSTKTLIVLTDTNATPILPKTYRIWKVNAPTYDKPTDYVGWLVGGTLQDVDPNEMPVDTV
jgi:hypothetical protein